MEGTEIVSLKRLRNKKYGSVLCYPRFSAQETSRRILELKRLDVVAIEFAGEKTAFSLRVLGKGCVGIVVIAHTKAGRVALKIRRVDSGREGMQREAEMLIEANSVRVGPRFIAVSENFLLMQFVGGSLLPQWIAGLRGRGTPRRIRRVLVDVMEQCWRLDQLGLDHGELSRAPKHIVIDAEDKAHILDFETASTGRRASNVTAVCQYLFLGSQLAKVLGRKVGKIDKDALVTALGRYKKTHDRQGFVKVLQLCGLTG